MEVRDHQRAFDAQASVYNTAEFPGRGHCARLVVDFVDPQAEDVILDVGCGPGDQIIAMAPKIKRGYGLDLSKKMLERAIAAGGDIGNLQFFAGSANALPAAIKNRSFSKIYSNYALHHLTTAEKRQTLLTLFSLLRPGGCLVYGDIILSDDPACFQNLFKYVAYSPECDSPATIAEIKEIFAESGLTYAIRILNPLVGIVFADKRLESRD